MSILWFVVVCFKGRRITVESRLQMSRSFRFVQPEDLLAPTTSLPARRQPAPIGIRRCSRGRIQQARDVPRPRPASTRTPDRGPSVQGWPRLYRPVARLLPKDEATGSLGTRGRQCNRASKGADGCDLMCCGRGYNAYRTKSIERCKCKFQWCCFVTCSTCERVVDVYNANERACSTCEHVLGVTLCKWARASSHGVYAQLPCVYERNVVRRWQMSAASYLWQLELHVAQTWNKQC